MIYPGIIAMGVALSFTSNLALAEPEFELKPLWERHSGYYEKVNDIEGNVRVGLKMLTTSCKCKAKYIATRVTADKNATRGNRKASDRECSSINLATAETEALCHLDNFSSYNSENFLLTCDARVKTPGGETLDVTDGLISEWRSKSQILAEVQIPVAHGFHSNLIIDYKPLPKVCKECLLGELAEYKCNACELSGVGPNGIPMNCQCMKGDCQSLFRDWIAFTEYGKCKYPTVAQGIDQGIEIFANALWLGMGSTIPFCPISGAEWTTILQDCNKNSDPYLALSCVAEWLRIFIKKIDPGDNPDNPLTEINCKHYSECMSVAQTWPYGINGVPKLSRSVVLRFNCELGAGHVFNHFKLDDGREVYIDAYNDTEMVCN